MWSAHAKVVPYDVKQLAFTPLAKVQSTFHFYCCWFFPLFIVWAGWHYQIFQPWRRQWNVLLRVGCWMSQARRKVWTPFLRRKELWRKFKKYFYLLWIIKNFSMTCADFAIFVFKTVADWQTSKCQQPCLPMMWWSADNFQQQTNGHCWDTALLIILKYNIKFTTAAKKKKNTWWFQPLSLFLFKNQ